VAGKNINGSRESGTRWHWLAPVLDGWRERQIARTASVESLKIYREVAATQPDLTGLARYEEVVARLKSVDAASARRVIRSAEDSFASWPVERPLKFRDVVEYLVVSECLESIPDALGTRSKLSTIVASMIPDYL
jgi:hypothetical protein